jgi:CheY-like chemotaxis protein
MIRNANQSSSAIKFTSQEQKRTITVTISASSQRPSAAPKPIVSYIPSRARKVAVTEGVDWGDGDEVFINFAVEDTGRGLTPDEMKILFTRFSQASPRTHVQYGGSGLGLFISRELTELQGGSIGVSSAAGRGSVFAFFVKARRTPPPKDPVEQLPPVTIGRRPEGGQAGPREPPPPKTKDFANVAASDVAAKEKDPLRILIVEYVCIVSTISPSLTQYLRDNLVNQRVLQKQLKNAGCITYVANHGGEALDQLRNSWFWAGKEDDPDVAQINIVLMDQVRLFEPQLPGTSSLANRKCRLWMVLHAQSVFVNSRKMASSSATYPSLVS